MRSLLLALALAAAATAPVDAQKNCTKGIPCGNTCIAANKVCRVGGGTATGTVAPRPLTAPAAVGSVVGSKADKVYFLEGCSAALDLAASNRRRFADAEDAERAGYRRSRVEGC